MPPSRALHKTPTQGPDPPAPGPLFEHLRAFPRTPEDHHVPPPPARLLFVVPPLAGHVNPTVALGAALSARGHAVAWAGAELFVRPLIGPDAVLFGTGSK